jgi:hypothetical protein
VKVKPHDAQLAHNVSLHFTAYRRFRDATRANLLREHPLCTLAARSNDDHDEQRVNPDP